VVGFGELVGLMVAFGVTLTVGFGVAVEPMVGIEDDGLSTDISTLLDGEGVASRVILACL